MRALWIGIGVLTLCSLGGHAEAGSETPPKGPPWERDILVAQEKALGKYLPIFLYFTKTY